MSIGKTGRSCNFFFALFSQPGLSCRALNIPRLTGLETSSSVPALFASGILPGEGHGKRREKPERLALPGPRN